jgi:putative ABC transport system permease protein
VLAFEADILGRLLGYHLRLAVASLGRDLRLTLAMFVCLGLGSGMWTMVVCHYLREYPARPALSPALHQVEILHPRALALDRGTPAEVSSWHARTRVTYPEYETLAASGIPTRQTGTLRAQVLIAAGGSSAAAQLANARFVEADFFSLFQIPIGRGRGLASDGGGLRPEIVLGRRLHDRLFGGADGLGRDLLVEGTPFRIVGVVDGDQPYRPEWDLVFTGKNQDGLYLPIAWARRLAAWPDQAVLQSPSSDIYASDAVFVSYWAELPTAEQRAAYVRYLDERLGRRGIPYRLRSYAEWRDAFPPKESDILFFTILLAIGLFGAAFTTARLLLAKGLARREELGIHRALGATRAALFVRQMVEAALVALPAAVAGLLHAAILHAIYNRIALENDIPVRFGATATLLGLAPSFAVGLIAAAYPAWRMSRTPPTVYLGGV